MAFLNALTDQLVSGFLADFWKMVIGQWFGFVANYGWRVVVFTVCLKLLLLPLDFWNRKKSFDNKRLMRRMKPEMDRIEKQYANNQQELMMRKRALQKKYGYGMGMTCLTSILTLIIFISVWTGFRQVSQDMNMQAYSDMLAFHESQIQSICKAPESILTADENGLTVTDAYWNDFVARYKKGSVVSSGVNAYSSHIDEIRTRIKTEQPDISGADLDAAVAQEASDSVVQTWAEDAYAEYIGTKFDHAVTAEQYSALFAVGWDKYLTDYEKTDDRKAQVEKVRTRIKVEQPDISEADLDAAVAQEAGASAQDWAKAYYIVQYKAVYGEELTDVDTAAPVKNLFDGKLVAADENDSIAKQLHAISEFAVTDDVVDFYENNVKESFLWVKNIWRPDTWVSPVLSATDYAALTGTASGCGSKSDVTAIDAVQYNTVMSGVNAKYSGKWNGYLIMVVLVVGLNFLNQWLSMRMQKASGEAQMAGAGANGTMKAMLFIMPLMMAFFAIQYATAFTVYMTVNALMTLASMGLCTLILSMREKRLDRLEAEGVVLKTHAEKRAEKRAAAAAARGHAPATRNANRGNDRNAATEHRPSYDRRNLKK